MNSFSLTRRIAHLFLLSLLTLSCVMAWGCKGDPNKEKLKHLAKGQEFLKDKKFREARLEFRNALLLDKKFADAFYGLAEASMGLNNLQEAADALEQVRELDPKNLDAKVRLGNLYLLNTSAKENVEAAAKLAEEVLGTDGNFIEGYILRAGVRTAQQKWAESEQDLKKAIELNAQRPESYLSYAKYYEQRAKLDPLNAERPKFLAEAERLFKQALQINPKSSISHLAYADFLFTSQRTGEAENELKLAVESDPKDQAALGAAARFYETQKNFGEAEKYILRLSEVTGDKNEGRAQIIDLHARDGKLDQAISEYQQLVSDSPKYLRAYVQLANLLVQKGDYNGAAQQIDAALKLNKQDTDALLTRGRINLISGKTREAISDLEQVLKQEPKYHQGLYLMAESLVQDGDPEKARAFTNDLLKYYPDNPMGLLMMIRVLLTANKATPADAAKDAGEAMKLADKIINGIGNLRSNAVALQASRMEPDSLNDFESKGYAARALAKTLLKDMSGAQADLERSAQLDPRNAETKANLASIYMNKNDVARARQLADEALALGGGSDSAITNVLRIYLIQKDYAGALQKIDELIAAKPYKKAYLLDQKVQVYAAQQDAGNVEKTLRQILEADPNYLNAYFELFAFYRNQNQLERAMGELQQLVDRRPNNPRQMAQALMLLGMMEEERGRYDDALKNYERSIGFDSRTAGASIALNNLAWLMADKGKGNLDKAAEHARAAIQLVPTMASYYDTLGYVLYRKKLYGVAVEQFQKAIEKKADEPSFYKHLGDTYSANNDKAKALQSYDKALKLGGANYRDADAVKSEMAKLR